MAQFVVLRIMGVLSVVEDLDEVLCKRLGNMFRCGCSLFYCLLLTRCLADSSENSFMLWMLFKVVASVLKMFCITKG